MSSNGEKIDSDDIFYFRQRQKNRVFSAVVSLFSKLAETEGLTKRELAFRLGKEPAQITRWLSGPSNLTLDTVSDLLLAMASELDHNVVSIRQPVYRSDDAHPLADINVAHLGPRIPGTNRTLRLVSFR